MEKAKNPCLEASPVGDRDGDGRWMSIVSQQPDWIFTEYFNYSFLAPTVSGRDTREGSRCRIYRRLSGASPTTHRHLDGTVCPFACA